MKIKTSELEGAALDWAVARCEGKNVDPWHEHLGLWLEDHKYSANWAQGGPIIERDQIEVMPTTMGGSGGAFAWGARKFSGDCELHATYGPTPLVAAMRCFVASKLGDSLEVPTELIG